MFILVLQESIVEHWNAGYTIYKFSPSFMNSCVFFQTNYDSLQGICRNPPSLPGGPICRFPSRSSFQVAEQRNFRTWFIYCTNWYEFYFTVCFDPITIAGMTYFQKIVFPEVARNKAQIRDREHAFPSSTFYKTYVFSNFFFVHCLWLQMLLALSQLHTLKTKE